MQFKLIIGLLMVPFSLLFGCVTAIRRFLYRKQLLHRNSSPIPAIDIGNLAVGGTGKTPHTQYIIGLLKRDFHVAALSRGYGRKTKGYLSTNTCRSDECTAATFGDEPYMTHLRYPDVPLAVDEDRHHGILNLISENTDLDVVILDDAYQHLSLQPSYHILLTEYDRPYCNDMPMPTGLLREFPCAAKDADTVIVTKVPDEASVDESVWRNKLNLLPQQHLFFTRFGYDSPAPVTEAAIHLDPEKKHDAVVLTGIAHPKPLLNHLKDRFYIIKHYNFPDHHTFSKSEIQNIYNQHFNNIGEQVILLTTEKDWMRLQAEEIINIVSLLPIFVIPVHIEFLTENQKDTFNQILQDHVRGKKKENC